MIKSAAALNLMNRTGVLLPTGQPASSELEAFNHVCLNIEADSGESCGGLPRTPFLGSCKCNRRKQRRDVRLNGSIRRCLTDDDCKNNRPRCSVFYELIFKKKN